MNAQTSLDFAHARKSDPATSHQAAASVKLTNLGRTRDAILDILRFRGPLADEEIWDVYEHRRCHSPAPLSKVSPSGLRSRRSELVRMGLVEASGIGKTQSGRDCQIWRLK